MFEPIFFVLLAHYAAITKYISLLNTVVLVIIIDMPPTATTKKETFKFQDTIINYFTPFIKSTTDLDI